MGEINLWLERRPDLGLGHLPVIVAISVADVQIRPSVLVVSHGWSQERAEAGGFLGGVAMNLRWQGGLEVGLSGLVVPIFKLSVTIVGAEVVLVRVSEWRRIGFANQVATMVVNMVCLASKTLLVSSDHDDS